MATSIVDGSRFFGMTSVLGWCGNELRLELSSQAASSIGCTYTHQPKDIQANLLKVIRMHVHSKATSACAAEDNLVGISHAKPLHEFREDSPQNLSAPKVKLQDRELS